MWWLTAKHLNGSLQQQQAGRQQQLAGARLPSSLMTARRQWTWQAHGGNQQCQWQTAMPAQPLCLSHSSRAGEATCDACNEAALAQAQQRRRLVAGVLVQASPA